MKSAEQIRAEMNAAVNAVRAYRGSSLYLAFIALLDAVDERHRDDLIDAKPEDVPHIQGAAQQVRKLRRVLVSDNEHMSPI